MNALEHINNLHWTAVMKAVVLGDGGPDHQAVLDALLSADADRTFADRDGVTPLEHAESRGSQRWLSDYADRIEPKGDCTHFFSLPESRV